MSDNKYLEKVARKYSWLGLGEQGARDALRSRVNIGQHQIGNEEHRRTSSRRPKVEKRSVLEKRALSSLSKGFKFTQSTSGVAKTKPKMPTVQKQLKPPKTVSEVKVNNPNKSMVKKSSAKAMAKKFLKDTASFSKNTAMGTGAAIKDSGKGTLQHAFGGKMRNFAKKDMKLTIPSEREAFMRMSDADKLKMVNRPEVKQKLKNLIRKRDASKAVVTAGTVAGGVGAVAGAKKVNQKLEEAKVRRQNRRNQKLLRQYYSRGY